METAEFNLMEYAQTVGSEQRQAYTFSDQVRDSRLLGRVVAPQGSELWRRGGPARLKVPKPGRTGEYLVMEADEALQKARAGSDGLRFVEALDLN